MGTQKFRLHASNAGGMGFDLRSLIPQGVAKKKTLSNKIYIICDKLRCVTCHKIHCLYNSVVFNVSRTFSSLQKETLNQKKKRNLVPISIGKESAGSAEARVRSLGWEDPLEEGMATHYSSILAWRIPLPHFLGNH